MFNLIVVLAAFASAAAFSVSPSRAARSSSLKMGFEDAVGAQPPLGKLERGDKFVFFFPVDFLANNFIYLVSAYNF